MNSWDLGNTVSCSAYLFVMGSWGFRILKCVLVGIGILGTLVLGPWGLWILKFIIVMGPLEPRILKYYLTWDLGNPGS